MRATLAMEQVSDSPNLNYEKEARQGTIIIVGCVPQPRPHAAKARQPGRLQNNGQQDVKSLKPILVHKDKNQHTRELISARNT